MVDVSKISCQNGKPYTNPGGLLSRCGDDLQSYVDVRLPPPDNDTVALVASMDATLTRSDRNRNNGANPHLPLVRKPGALSNRLVVSFDEERLARPLEQGTLAQARLVLTRQDGSSGRGGHIVVASPIPVDFIEGDGNLTERSRGSGSGVTWNCAIDLEIADRRKECGLDWPRPDLPRPGARVFQEDGGSGPISWDVTDEVHTGVYAWMLLKEQGPKGGSARYHSREGAANQRSLALAPRLILEFEPE